MTIRPARRAPRDGTDRLTPLHTRAEADLAFVRGVLERSHHFTAVPGIGGVGMGLTALVAAYVASTQPTPQRRLSVWLLEAALAASIGAIALVLKARRSALPLDAGPARRFALGLVPPILAGGMLTVACVVAQAWTLLTPVWLACYGTAVLGGGAVSTVRAIPLLGAAFLATTLLAVATPAAWGDAWMALAFGGGHLISGTIVARHHGG